MLSIGHISAGHGKYYLDLAREDYYLEGGEPPGQWWGKTAESFNLTGEVNRSDLRSFLYGMSPDGQALVQNAGKKNRRAGFDLTFSAPKSVSVLWAVAPLEIRRTVQTAHEAAVKAALHYLEREAAFSRRGKEGKDLVRADLAVALFEHGTSRAVDPQLHTHCLVMNICRGVDGQTATLEGRRLYRHKMAAGALYRTELAHQLVNRLGLELEVSGVAFEILGIPQALLKEQSQRRTAIEEHLTAKGLETAGAAAHAALATRGVKGIVPPREKLFEEWQKQAQKHGFTREVAEALLRTPPEPPSDRTIIRELSKAAKDITSNLSQFTERELVRRTADRLLSTPVPATRLTELVTKCLSNSRRFIPLKEQDGYALYTTPAVIALEQKTLRSARQLSVASKHSIPSRLVDKAIKRVGELNEEQASTVHHLTSRRGGALRIVQGLAGTGKTTMLNAARQAWEKAGYKVYGVAVAGKAAKELRRGAGIPTETFAMLDLLLDKTFAGRFAHHVKQIARAAARKPTFPLSPFKIDERTVLVVDEASMLSTQQMARVVEATKKGGGLLVLIGDRKQLPAIQAGGAFGAMLDRFRHAIMEKIVRQRHPDDVRAVEAAARGDMKAAVRHLDSRGCVTIAKSRDDAIGQLMSEWRKRELEKPADGLIFCATNADAQHVNQKCQEERLRGGALDKRRFVKLGDSTFYQGDRVMFTKRSRQRGLENGETATIVETNSLTKSILVRTDDGVLTTIPLRKYPNVTLAYAVTTHKGQGTTVERSYILLGGPMQDRELTYVQLSRARESSRLFISRDDAGPELRDLLSQMSRSSEKYLATPPPEEVLRPRAKTPPMPGPQPAP